MSNSFPAVLVGNLTTDPVLTSGEGARTRVNFSIAVNDRALVDGAWVDKGVVFHGAVAFGHLAGRIAATLTKGVAVVAAGDLAFSAYETDEGRRQGWSLVVRAIGPSIATQDVTTTRMRPSDGQDEA